MKKIISFILVISLALAFSVNSFAAGYTIDFFYNSIFDWDVIVSQKDWVAGGGSSFGGGAGRRFYTGGNGDFRYGNSGATSSGATNSYSFNSGMDELSVQMNSRSFKDNFNAYFLNTLLCCRHYHISFFGSAQRFQHVDKLMRDVTHTVIQCKKIWRFQLWQSYDAWELENATNAELIRPLGSGLWFVLDKDYNAYDTLAVVDNLRKKVEEGDLLTEAEIIANQNPSAPLGLDAASSLSRKGKLRIGGRSKR